MPNAYNGHIDPIPTQLFSLLDSLVCLAVRRIGFDVYEVENGDDVLEILKREKPYRSAALIAELELLLTNPVLEKLSSA